MQPKKIMTSLVVVALAGASLAGCQSTQESAYNAASTCNAAGLRPGTAAFRRCSGVVYSQNRAQSDQATTAAVAGLAVGALGGAIAGAAISRPYGGYGYGYGYRPWGYYGGYRPWGYYY